MERESRKNTKAALNDFDLEIGAKRVEESGEEDKDEFVEESEDHRVKTDRKLRQKYEYALLKRTKELFAVEERMYSIRHDKSAVQEDIQRDLKNLCTHASTQNLLKEHSRLRGIIAIMQDKAYASFERSMHLGGVNLPASINDEMYKVNPVTMKAEATLKNVKVEEDELAMLEELENQKFMRTVSTQVLKDQSPAQKWHSLYKMLREWKTQSAVAEAQQIMTREQVAQHTEEDITALRQAIFKLRMRKELSKADQLLLKRMTRRLAELTKSR